MSDQQTTKWFNHLTDNINSLCEEFGLNDMQTNRFRDFTITLAKEQYRVGSKSGAAWVYKQVQKGTQAKPV